MQTREAAYGQETLRRALRRLTRNKRQRIVNDGGLQSFVILPIGVGIVLTEHYRGIEATELVDIVALQVFAYI